MSGTPRADFWFSILLSAFGGAIVVESWRMPRLENLGVDPMSAPGLTPGLLGLVLTGLGLMLFVRSLRARKTSLQGDGTEASGGWYRFLVTLVLCLVYALLLLGRLPFWAATGLFVFSFVLTFTWQRHSLLRVGASAAALAVAVAVSVTLLFEQVFLVRLP